MAGRYSERTGRARSTYRKATLSANGSTLGTSNPIIVGFPQLNETRELIKCKHIRGELAISLTASSSRMNGWYGWCRWTETEVPDSSALIIDDSRFFGVKPFAITGNLSRSFPVELMGVNVTPADKVYFVIVPQGGNVTNQGNYSLACLCDIELQVFN